MYPEAVSLRCNGVSLEDLPLGLTVLLTKHSTKMVDPSGSRFQENEMMGNVEEEFTAT